MIDTKNLKIYNKPAYVWRVDGFGFASHNYIPCWYVEDNESGKIIRGGYNCGGNTHGGYSYITRRKDAKAFVAGIEAFNEGRATIATFGKKERQFPVVVGDHGFNPRITHGFDKGQQDQEALVWFEEGVQYAFDRAIPTHFVAKSK